MKKYILLLLTIFFISCVTIYDLREVYFTKPLPNGVKSLHRVLTDNDKSKELRALYYKEKAQRMLTCLLLRNQFYAAFFYSDSISIVNNLAKKIENAYENNDDDFLKTCEEISSLKEGKIFLDAQKKRIK